MADAQREESEAGKFSLWVYVKNWVSDYLKTTDLNLDGSGNAGVNVKTIQEEIPTSTSKNNPSYSFSYDGDGRLQYIYQTIGLTQWRKTITYTSGRISSIGSWIIVI